MSIQTQKRKNTPTLHYARLASLPLAADAGGTRVVQDRERQWNNDARAQISTGEQGDIRVTSALPLHRQRLHFEGVSSAAGVALRKDREMDAHSAAGRGRPRLIRELTIVTRNRPGPASLHG